MVFRSLTFPCSRMILDWWFNGHNTATGLEYSLAWRRSWWFSAILFLSYSNPAILFWITSSLWMFSCAMNTWRNAKAEKFSDCDITSDPAHLPVPTILLNFGLCQKWGYIDNVWNFYWLCCFYCCWCIPNSWYYSCAIVSYLMTGLL